MEIGFFEEFPDDNNLSKIKLLDFSSVVYAAANSFKDFVTIRNKIKKMNSKIEVAYWPVLEKSYWISPFSYNFELRGLYRDLLKNRDKKTLKVLLDLELPFLNPRLFFINLPDFFINKKLIEKIFTESKKLNIENCRIPFHWKNN